MREYRVNFIKISIRILIRDFALILLILSIIKYSCNIVIDQ